MRADTEPAGGGDLIHLAEGQQLDIDVSSELGGVEEDLVGRDRVQLVKTIEKDDRDAPVMLARLRKGIG